MMPEILQCEESIVLRHMKGLERDLKLAEDAGYASIAAIVRFQIEACERKLVEIRRKERLNNQGMLSSSFKATSA